jgi:FMN phosphatase YigB (HAD superfamily)
LKKIVFFDIDDVLFKTNVFINSGLKKYEAYKDAKKIIQKVKSLNNIAILSKGEQNLQFNKLKRTKLLELFQKENIFIVNDKGREAKKVFSEFKSNNIVLIDDRIDTLWEIKKDNPKVKTIWIKRGRHKNLTCNFKPDYSVKNLNQAFKAL